jgi:hypothetical protein
VHFFVASKRPGGVASRHWFSAADWGACRVRLVPGRKVEVTRSSSGDGRATIRVGQAVVTADAAQADAIEALFGLIDGQRSLNEIIAALTPAVTFTEIEWRELFHYLADRYGLLELAAPGTDLGRT